MTSDKSGQSKDRVWEQHLRWLDLARNECASNQLKREREKRRRESIDQGPDANARSS